MVAAENSGCLAENDKEVTQPGRAIRSASKSGAAKCGKDNNDLAGTEQRAGLDPQKSTEGRAEQPPQATANYGERRSPENPNTRRILPETEVENQCELEARLR